jgi:hypothetical protein
VNLELEPDSRPPAKLNPVQRIVGVLVAPGDTFQDIAQRPNWVLPLILAAVIATMGSFVLSSRIDYGADMRAALEKQHVPPQQIEKNVRLATSFGKGALYVLPLLAPVGLLIMAAVLMIAFRMFGGDVSFSQAFSVFLHAWIPQLIASLISFAVLLTRHSVTTMEAQSLIRSNLSFLVDAKAQPVLWTLLTSFDVFTFWTLFLLVVGFAAVTRFSKAKSAAIVLTVWAIGVLLKLIGPAIQQTMGSRS